jgi:pimeloyl-ACP methyl ester carboxylesterase
VGRFGSGLTVSRVSNGLRASVLVAAIAVTLSGCFLLPNATPQPGGEPTASSADFASYFSQDVNWRSCGSLKCAVIEVPTDWTDPASSPVNIAIAKKSAATKATGTIFVNPGGPGGSGVGFVEYAVSSALYDAFDVVGWDPRGVGDSTPVVCFEGAQKDEQLYGTYTDPYMTQGWIDELNTELADYVSACEKGTGDLLAHVDTVSTAHDLELMRALITGDAPLDYLGYSYGTFIGAVYAELFPDQVGKFVLDGAVDPQVGAFDELIVQAVGFEDNLRAYMADCLSGSDCPFTGTLDQALTQANALMGSVDGKALTSSDGRVLDSATVGTGVAMSLYSSDYWPYLTKLFVGLQTNHADPTFLLADVYNDRANDGSYDSNSVEVYQATTCEDNDWAADTASPLERLAQISDAAPTLGEYLTLDDYAVLDVLCSNWPYPAAQLPTVFDAAGAAPILVIGTTNDPATPYAWAQSLAEQLESGVLITVTGDGHTAYNADNSCVNAVVDGYFLTGMVPASDPRC